MRGRERRGRSDREMGGGRKIDGNGGMTGMGG